MKESGWWVFSLVLVGGVVGNRYTNVTDDPSSRQLLQFKQRHPKPIGVLTTDTGAPVDVRDTYTLNSDVLSNEYFLDSTIHLDSERIPERVVHAKGGGAYGIFEVTNDVSKYTSADVFNGIGKKTHVVTRFSTVIQSLGGADATRETKGLAVKFYTKEGNLDLTCINFPVYFYRDANDFINFAHSFKRNPKTNLFDFNARWDFVTKRPDSIHSILWFLSDYGFPANYRTMDAFPVHAFELNNKHGDRYYVRFNFRTEQGLQNLTNEQGNAINDLDYYNRDLYNAIEKKNYPAWCLEMDVISLEELKNLDYNPFDVTKIWEKGTYKTVPIGRLILTKNPDNYFRDIEQGAYSPANLVPGIPGPIDSMFKGRRLAYRDSQNHRLGINHNKIEVNKPKYAKTFNRDGNSPVLDNMKDVPIYYPNSFNGPVPFVDEARPKENLLILQSNAVDLQYAADFLNYYAKDPGHRQRIAQNTVETFPTVYPPIIKRAIRLLSLISPDLGRRVKILTEEAGYLDQFEHNDHHFKPIVSHPYKIWN